MKLSAGDSNSLTRGPYKSYTLADRYKIGKHAAEYGNMSAVRKFSAEMNRKLSERTVRGFKKNYYEQIKLAKKRKLDDIDYVESRDVPESTPKVDVQFHIRGI